MLMVLNSEYRRGTSSRPRLTNLRWCMAPDGSEVLVVAESSVSSEGDGHSDESPGDGEQEMDCHFHAGVE